MASETPVAGREEEEGKEEEKDGKGGLIEDGVPAATGVMMVGTGGARGWGGEGEEGGEEGGRGWMRNE